MSIAFAFPGFGYLMAVHRYFVPNQQLLANIGDVLRLFGLLGY